METVALFGGSFDPPHIGHEAIVEALLELNYLNKIIVMPTFLNPFKSKSFASGELRFSWLKKIFKSSPKVLVDDFEISHKESVPTIKTLRHLLSKYDKVFIVVGADNLSSLKMWKEYEALKQNATFIVVTREKITISQEFIKLIVDEEVSSSELRANMNTHKLPKCCAQEIAHFYKETNVR